MPLRIGINVGDVMVKDGDIFGDGVNVAARLEAIAEPGGTVLRAGCATMCATAWSTHSKIFGEHRVKNVARPVRVFRSRV